MCWLVWTSKDLGGRPPLASRCISLSWLFFHGGNTGSNPVGDAKSFQELKRAQAVFRRHKKEAELLRYFASRMSIHRWRLFLTRRSYISKLSLWKCTSNPRRNPA